MTHKSGLKATIKACKTVNDLLAKDDVTEVLKDMENLKPEIVDCLTIYKTRSGAIGWECTEETLKSQLVFMLESMKFDLMTENMEV